VGLALSLGCWIWRVTVLTAMWPARFSISPRKTLKGAAQLPASVQALPITRCCVEDLYVSAGRKRWGGEGGEEREGSMQADGRGRARGWRPCAHPPAQPTIGPTTAVDHLRRYACATPGRGAWPCVQWARACMRACMPATSPRSRSPPQTVSRGPP